jgi:hypothetical protein
VSVRATASFDRRWTLFWATTYTFEPVFFESFLLPRLGEPPLNATILADAYRYADALQDLSSDAPWRSTRANRDYLIRGVVVTGGAFHPKTYLFGDLTGGRLVVGSGNLAMSGLETGKELFAAFDSGEPAGLAGIRAWRAWMDDLVAEIDDQAVRDRWRDAQVRAPWLVGPADSSAFVTNWDRPLMDAVLDGIDRPVDELHLTAPFFDEQAAAVADLVRRARPARVEMLLGRDASVHGPALVSALQASGAEVAVHGLDPEMFVHGKLVGLVWQGRGRILSGSANLSTAALLRTVRRDAHANVEAGVIAETTPEQVRAAFAPPPPPAGLSVVPRPLESLTTLAFAPGKEARFPYLLRSATWLADGRVRVDLKLPPTERLELRCDTASSPLADRVTVAPFADVTARLVWIATPDGVQRSNKVAIDEPRPLRAALEDRGEAAGDDRPGGLEAADLETPVGLMLARLNQACIFDFDETPTAGRIRRAVEESEDPEFWDRLAREDLRSDPRVARYHQLHEHLELLDGLFLDLARMRDAVPPLPQPHALGGPEDAGGATGTGVKWTADKKLQVRLFNLLERWCTALADPRLAWVGPVAQVGNFAALVGAVYECWANRYLPEHRLVPLVGVLLTSFLASERRPGYMAGLDDETRATAELALSGSAAPEFAAGLVWASVRPAHTDLLSFLFAWQPGLLLAQSCGAVRATELSSLVADELTEMTIGPGAIATRIAWAAEYTNDARWCEVLAQEFRLSRLELVAGSYAKHFGAVLRVEPGVDLLGESRFVEIVRRALAYRGTGAAIVEAGADRLVIQLDEVPAAKIGGRTFEGEGWLTVAELEAMARDGSPFSVLFERAATVAS